MKTKILILALLVSTNFSQTKTYNFDEIIISGGRRPLQFGELARTVSVLSAADISKLPVNNFQDLLKFINGLDLRSRGTEGVQSDISIRGGSFEQTLILIDGIKIIDPQTGHHNLNLPLNLDNIERVEIIKGNGTKVFGSNAFSGAINFITKKKNKNSFATSALIGEHGLFDLSFSASSNLNNNFFISRKKSDGYRFNTNFKNDIFSFSQNFVGEKSNFNLFLGYTDKNFGANSFYSDRFPNQSERTLTRFASLNGDMIINQFIITPKLFYRNNFDDYHLDFLRPDWNHNTHFTEYYGGEIQASLNSSIGQITSGLEFTEDKINSSNLGTHSRNQLGFFIEHNYNVKKSFSISSGLFIYKYPNLKWKVWPGIDIGYFLDEHHKVFGSFGKSFRVPTYTELFYVSPANMGNPNLVYEGTTNYEIGYNFLEEFFEISSSIFYKNGNNLIDWVRKTKTDAWKVENVSNLKTTGFELTFTLLPKFVMAEIPISLLKFDYTFLSSNRNIGSYESKYLLDNLKHKLIVHFIHELFFDVETSWSIRYEKRENFDWRFLVDTQILKNLNSFSLFIRANNLFNKTYFDYPGVILPGRWISAGIKYSLEFN